MVTSRLRTCHGKAPVGFLVTLAVFGVLIYYGSGAGRSYVTYYRMKDEMQVQARVASNLSDEDIRRHLRTKAADLQLPPAAQHITIRRRARPREIVVTMSWPDTITLPFYRWVLAWQPEVRAPL